MEKIAFIAGGQLIYWSSVILTLAAAAAVCVFLALYLGKSGNLIAGFAVVPVAMLLSVLASRFVHWYSHAESYESFRCAMTDYSTGSFALVGVFIGCLLAAVLIRLLRLHKNLPQMLDCMCLAGSIGIAVGRLASLFNSSDRGQIVESVRSMPWVYPVTNAVSGATEYRLATFLLQAMVAAALFLALTLFYLTGKRRNLKDGDTCLLFLLCYGTSQVVLDSTRYDSIYFRSNGFVSIVQVLGALFLVIAIVVFSVRLVKARGFKAWYIALWTASIALIGGAGYMEYHVQRHGNQAVFAYSVMSLCLCAVVILTLVIRAAGGRKPKGKSSYQGRFLR